MQTQPKPVVIVGNCLAGMVAAAELGMQGTPVVLVNGSRNWGGHFTSRNIRGANFDLGTVCFEFTSFAKDQLLDVSLYGTRARYDIARFCQASRDYVEGLLPIHESSTPLMVWKGEIVPDLIMANDLSILRRVSEGAAAQIERETRAILACANRPLHASTKLDNPLYVSSSYEDASLANHGAMFHRMFVEPFADKLLPGGARSFAAIYHRCLWMPLYYPETVLAALGPQPHALRPTLFHYPAKGYVGALPEAILERMGASGRVTIVAAEVTEVRREGIFRISLSTGEKLEAERLVWGLDLASLARVSGISDIDSKDASEKKTSAAFCFLIVDRKKIRATLSSLFVVDRERIAYRIANQSEAAAIDEPQARLVVECNAQFFGEGKPDLELLTKQVCQDLIELGIVEAESAILHAESLYAPQILPIPNENDRERCLALLARVRDRLPTIESVGPASGYFTKSLNDQLIQGLQVAKRCS